MKNKKSAVLFRAVFVFIVVATATCLLLNYAPMFYVGMVVITAMLAVIMYHRLLILERLKKLYAISYTSVKAAFDRLTGLPQNSDVQLRERFVKDFRRLMHAHNRQWPLDQKGEMLKFRTLYYEMISNQ